MDWTTIVMIVVVVGALYLLMIRPQQKRAKQQKEHMASLQPGSRVMTVHGIFGTIVHLGEKQVILEVSPGVELTMVKAAISNQPVEDEFEYDDEPAAVEPATPALAAAPAVAAVAAGAAVAPEVASAASADDAATAEPAAASEPASEPAANEPAPADGTEDEADAGTSIPDFTDDASFSQWWDQHFPKN